MRRPVDSCVLLACAAIMVPAAMVCSAQTASVSTNKPKTSSRNPFLQNTSKASPTNSPSRLTNGVLSRVHMKIGKDSEPEFLGLVNGKKAIMEDMRTIRRISREKQAALERIDSELAKAYSIESDRNYRYDVQSRTIYEVDAALPDAAEADRAGTDTTVTTNAPATGGKRMHLVIENNESAERFVQLTAARRLNAAVVRVLVLLEQEKTASLAEMSGTLLKKFGVSRDRGYEYDTKTGILSELIAVPSAAKAVSR